MVFDIIEDDGISIVLAPLRVSILHSHFQVQLGDRFRAIARDLGQVSRIRAHNVELAEAIEAHSVEIGKGINSTNIRKTADAMINLKSELFGQTNAGSALRLIEVMAKPEIEAENIWGREGRLLTRLHTYRERDRQLARRARTYYKRRSGGILTCEACGTAPTTVYGPRGEHCMEVHHKIPIEQLQPDSVIVVKDMAMVCASCHRIIHSKQPCLTISEMNELVAAHDATVHHRASSNLTVEVVLSCAGGRAMKRTNTSTKKPKKAPRPMPTDPKDLARAMFRDVERKNEAWKLKNDPESPSLQDPVPTPTLKGRGNE